MQWNCSVMVGAIEREREREHSFDEKHCILANASYNNSWIIIYELEKIFKNKLINV